MATTGERITSLLFSLACGLLVILVSIQLWDRWNGKAVASKKETVAVEKVSGLDLDVSGVARRGAHTANVLIVEFSDFECPFCGKYAQVNYPQIQKEFVDTGIVSYAFVHFPLDRIHPRATRAAEAAECAGFQSAFWPMHDLLFAQPRDLGEQRLFDNASALKLDAERYRACMAGATLQRIDSQKALAELAGVSTTPTFLIGTRGASGNVVVSRRVLGAQPFKIFADAIAEVRKGQ